MAKILQGPKTWVIAHIDKDNVLNIQDRLESSERFSDVVAFVPTVRVLKKVFKGKEHFEYIPLLFNYGFFGINPEKFNITYLENLKATINPCIFNWVKDICIIQSFTEYDNEDKTLKRNKNLQIATATQKEIDELKKINSDLCIYDKNDLNDLILGKEVILKGYPFDGYKAKILEIMPEKKRVRVELLLEVMAKDVIIHYDNLLYTIYNSDHVEVSGMKELSSDDPVITHSRKKPLLKYIFNNE